VERPIVSPHEGLIDEARDLLAKDNALPLDLVIAMASAGLDVEAVIDSIRLETN